MNKNKTNPNRRTLYLVLAVILIGGVSFLFSQSEFLKGAFNLSPDYSTIETPSDTDITVPPSTIIGMTAEEAAEAASTYAERAAENEADAADAADEATLAYNNKDEDALSAAQTAADTAADKAEAAAESAQKAADRAQSEYERLQAAYEDAQDELDAYRPTRDDAIAEKLKAEIACTAAGNVTEAQATLDEANDKLRTAELLLASCDEAFSSSCEDQYETAKTAVDEAEAELATAKDQLAALTSETDEASICLEAGAAALRYEFANEEYEKLVDAKEEARLNANKAKDYAAAAQTSADAAAESAENARASANFAKSYSVQVCTSLTLDPSSYTADVSEFPAHFNLTATVNLSGDTTSAFNPFNALTKTLRAFTLGAPSMPTDSYIKRGWTGNLVFETDGSGTFTYGGSNNNPLVVPMTAEGSITVAFTGGVPEETITVSIEGEESPCSDSIVLKGTATVGDDEEPVDEPTEEPTDDPRDEEVDIVEILGKEYSCEDPFVDTRGQWSEDLVCRMYQARIVNGRTPTRFVPNDNITRAEWIKVVDLIYGYEPSEATGLTTRFTDVSVTDWYYPYIVIAENQDVIRTRDLGDKFNPNAPITRADALLYAIRMARLTDYSYNVETTFKDVKNTDYFAYALAIASETEVDVAHTEPDGTVVVQEDVPVIGGYPDGTFHPYSNILRSEAMAIALRVTLAWGVAAP